MIWPVLQVLPFPIFIPRRFPAESRPFEVEPPPRLVAHRLVIAIIDEKGLRIIFGPIKIEKLWVFEELAPGGRRTLTQALIY